MPDVSDGLLISQLFVELLLLPPPGLKPPGPPVLPDELLLEYPLGSSEASKASMAEVPAEEPVSMANLLVDAE